MNDRQALYSEKRFPSPRRRPNPQPFHDQLSEDCGFDPRLGSEIVFLSIGLDDHLSIISKLNHQFRPDTTLSCL